MGAAIEGITGGDKKAYELALVLGTGTSFFEFFSAWRSSPIHEHSVDFR